MFVLKSNPADQSAVERKGLATVSRPVLSGEIPAERMALENKIGLLPGKPADNPPSEHHGFTVILPNKAEPCRLSPEEKEIDAYISALEYEVSQKRKRMPETQDEGWEAATRFRANHHPDSRALHWYAVTVMIGCFGWLSYILYEAFN
jgi:hypothetical protein